MLCFRAKCHADAVPCRTFAKLRISVMGSPLCKVTAMLCPLKETSVFSDKEKLSQFGVSGFFSGM